MIGEKPINTLSIKLINSKFFLENNTYPITGCFALTGTPKIIGCIGHVISNSFRATFTACQILCFFRIIALLIIFIQPVVVINTSIISAKSLVMCVFFVWFIIVGTCLWRIFAGFRLRLITGLALSLFSIK